MTERARPEDIEALVEIFQRSDWKEMSLRYKDVDLFLSKDEEANVVRRVRSRNKDSGDRQRRKPARPRVQPLSPQGDAASDEGASTDNRPDHWIAVKAPNLGTFYRSSKPGAPPFVELGQCVTPETEICLIEVMKLFTALKAGVSGVVKQICAEDGELIKNGQTLFYIEPDAE